MCDYSLQSVKTRKARVGDKLITRDFNTGTRGFTDLVDCNTAVCLLPGTEIAFDKPVHSHWLPHENVVRKTAVFMQVNKDDPKNHHDALSFPDGRMVLLTYLSPGQTATVLQLPADPSKLQHRRVEYAG